MSFIHGSGHTYFAKKLLFPLAELHQSALHILHSRGTIMSPTGTLLIVKTAGEY
jgi:hypothetical protein